MYLLTNDKESKLGTTPLPDGVVRVFRDNGRDGLSYLTQQAIKYIPIGDKIELNLGVDPEVVFELDQAAGFARRHLDADQRHERRSKESAPMTWSCEVNSTVVGWDDHSIYPPADPQLHGQADRGRNPPQLRRPRRSSAASSKPTLHRLPDGSVHRARRRRRKEGPAVRDRPPPRPQREAEQRDAEDGRG